MKTRKKNSTPKTHNSLLLYSLMETISKAELQKMENKMRLAIKIADAIEAKGLKKHEFAKKINKNNSEMDKWLSGAHNFTVETLFFCKKNWELNY